MSAPRSYAKPGEEIGVDTPIRKILFSHPGEGKTINWGSLQDRALFMVSDPEGTISASAMGFKFHRVNVTDYDELQETYEWLKEDKPPFGGDFNDPNNRPWIIWDSLSTFQERGLHDDIMLDAIADNPKQDRYVPSRREYFQSMNRIGDFTRRFCGLPYNFGVSCHVMEQPAPDGDGMIFVPAVMGKGMAMKVSGYMNVVGYLHKREVDGKIVQSELLQMDPSRRLYAKNRFAGSTGKYLDGPSAIKFEAAVNAWRQRVREAEPAAPSPSRRRRTLPSAKGN